MIGRRELVRVLARVQDVDWVVIEHAQELATHDELRDIRRTESRTRLALVLHHDVTRGRGSVRVTVTATDGSARQIVEQAIALADTAVGQAWQTPPPAAPAKVDVLDRQLERQLAIPLADVATGLVRGVRRPEGGNVLASATVMREQVHVQARNNFHADWEASEYRVGLLVIAAGRSLELVREARRPDELRLDAAVAQAAADLRDLAQAGAPVGGRCRLVLGTDALLHGDDLGVWQVFATQADAVLERQGLARYRLHAPIAPGADHVEEPLTVVSDGALDFGTRSAPVGEDGDAVRRFPIIERGVCLGHGLSVREAALQRREPNGGVRNLDVRPGTWNGVIPQPVAQAGERVVELRRLRALSIDPLTGDASLEIALGVDHRGTAARMFTGGTVRLDLVAALARARRSATVVQRGAYLGPTAVLVDDAELIV